MRRREKVRMKQFEAQCVCVCDKVSGNLREKKECERMKESEKLRERKKQRKRERKRNKDTERV